MNDNIWKQWRRQWEWILSVANARQWVVKPLQIEPVIDLWDIVDLEKQLGFHYPNEFKHVLANYAGGVSFNWLAGNDTRPSEFKDTFGANHYLWDFHRLKGYSYWLTDDNVCLDKTSAMYDELYVDKVPFLHIPNGDEIVFDVSNGLDNCPVIYLNHEDEELHGAKLADNFIEFITLWSNIGCPGGESWQLKPFYDEAAQKLAYGKVVDRWKQWLERSNKA